VPREYYQFMQFWEKLQFREFSDYLNQSYYIMKKLEWYKQAENEGRDRKDAQNKR